MQKTLKFVPELAKLILEGKKTSTWRLWDDKNIIEGDIVDFLARPTLEKFATVRITKVLEKPIGSLTTEEKYGHEVYANDEEMYKTLEGYYQKQVDSNTTAKVIWFEILEQ